MSDVFVSYKAEDRKRVQPLVQALQGDGLSVWWDEHIGAGDAWRETIEQQLDEARCVLVVWSKRSVGAEGKFVRDEASRAQRRGSYVPVLIDAVEPPLGFGESQATSLRGWRGDRADPHYQAVLAAVQRHLGGKRRRSSRPIAAPRVDRRTAIAGSAAAAIVVVGVGGWALLRPSSAGATGSIAVLPFANLSGDPSQSYFSDGLAEELRSALSRIAQLQVVARTSSEAVRNDDAKTAAQKLGVADILTGSVRRSPTLIRVDAQLVDGHTGLERWSQTFDRPLGDVLAIQTSIAENVADALSIQLGRAGKAALVLGGTRNAQAHDLFLKADPGRADDTQQGLERAIAWLDLATQLDPNYAEAYARKAIALNFYAGTYAKGQAAMAAGFANAIASAKRAISLAPRLASGHAALAATYKNQLQLKAAFDELQLAVDLPGTDVVALRNYGGFLAQLGRFNEAWKAATQAAMMDPLSPAAFELKGLVLYMSHHFADAIANAGRSLELGPNRVRVRSLLANALLMSGRASEALAEFEKLPPTDVHRLMGMAAIAGLSGDRGRSDEIIRQIRGQFGDNASYQYAQVYAQRRQPDDAIASLRKAVEVRDPGLPGIKVDPFLDPIRKDPRLADIIRQLDFPA